MLGKEVGSYKILEKIGQGGMGAVYKAIHTKLEQEVAIKVLHPQFSQDPLMRKRFIKEARIQAKFTHPNVVNILNYLEDQANIFLIMEYVNGETLEDRLKRDGALTIENAVSLSIRVLGALNFMHSEGVIHRDIKPSNIMFTDTGVVKVTDFGIAKVLGEKAQTRTGIAGTFRYMSPEQILGEETNIASDVYSFGITFYEMVTGRVPFNSDSEYKIMKGHLEENPIPPWEVNSNVSRKLGKVILKALAKCQKDRYQNVKELEEEMGSAIKKTKGTRLFLRIINSSSKGIQSLNLAKNGFLLLALGIILFCAFFWLVKKPDDIISGVFNSAVSKPDTDISKIEESDQKFGSSNFRDINSKKSHREITKFDNLGNQIEKPGPAPNLTTTPARKDMEDTRWKKVDEIRELPIKRESVLSQQAELQKKSKWKIRK